MRWCGGSWTRRSCRRCSRARGRRRCSRRATRRPPSLFVQTHGGQIQLLAAAGCDADAARALALAAVRTAGGPPLVVSEPIGRAPEGARFAVLSTSRPLAIPTQQRFRTLCAVLRQGFDLCQARERPSEAAAGRARAPARAAAPGIRLRQRRDAARRRSDSAHAGERPDGADHRRERDRQGPGRPRDSRRIAAPRQHVPALQLHERDARAGRQPAVRTPPRQLHRRDRRSGRACCARRSAARSFSTRSATCRSTSSRSCSGFSNREKCCRSATRGLSASTSASSRRPTRTSSSASPTASSAKTCSTG